VFESATIIAIIIIVVIMSDTTAIMTDVMEDND
jgi:hypothetical protein